MDMRVFKLGGAPCPHTLPAPKEVKQQIRSIKRDFLWGKGEEKKKLALVA